LYSKGKKMWWKEYKDYPPGKPLVKERVEPGKGIIGCEMHSDVNSWGNQFQPRPKKKTGFLYWAFSKSSKS
jgi:hypothetical protein